MDDLKATHDGVATASESVPSARTKHGGNVGADMVPYYLQPGQCDAEHDQGHWVVVSYDDAYNLAERKDRLYDALLRVLKSAVPNERDHPSMWAAWRAAEKVIRDTRPWEPMESGKADPAVVAHVDNATGRPRASSSSSLSLPKDPP